MRTMFRAFAALALACLFAGPVSAEDKCPTPSFDFVVGELEPLVGTVFSELLVYRGERATKYMVAVREIYNERLSREPTEIVVVLSKDADDGELFAFQNECLIGGGPVQREAHRRVIERAFGAGA